MEGLVLPTHVPKKGQRGPRDNRSVSFKDIQGIVFLVL